MQFLWALILYIQEKKVGLCLYAAGFLCWILLLLINRFEAGMILGLLALVLWIGGIVVQRKGEKKTKC